MWNFLAKEANWTEVVANTLALGFSLMTIVVITYAVMFNPDILAAVGSVTSGITGVILGYYFNRSRLKVAQRRADLEAQERRLMSEVASMSEEQLTAVIEDFRNLVVEYEQQLQRQESDGEQDNGTVE